MITIYHNPRCSKSRSCLLELENLKEDFEIRNYISNPLTQEELEAIISKLKINAIDLVRKNETVWKENYKNQNFTNEEVIQLLLKHPNLIERPIVIKDDKGIIARPLENVYGLLK